MSTLKRFRDRIKFEFEKFIFKPYVMVRKVDGLNINVYINNLFAKHWYKNAHKWPELRWLKENLIEEGDVVFDCGANSGYTTVFFSKLVGENGKVFAFEPHPLNIESILKNVEINKSSNVQTIGKAVGSTKAKVKISKHPNASIMNLNDEGFVVDVVTLDDFQIANPTFVKIDVEGFELEVLKGATEVLKKRPKLDIEIHCAAFNNKLDTIKEIFKLVDPDWTRSWIQINVNSPIEKYDSTMHTFEAMAKEEVVHFFTTSAR